MSRSPLQSRLGALIAIVALLGAGLPHAHPAGPHAQAHSHAATPHNAEPGNAEPGNAEPGNAEPGSTIASDDRHHEHSSQVEREREACLACRSSSERVLAAAPQVARVLPPETPADRLAADLRLAAPPIHAGRQPTRAPPRA